MTVADELLLLDTPATRPCTHRRVQHEHGTEGRYSQDGCHCAACRAAHAVYEAEHPPTAGHGRWSAFADPTEARVHVEQLMRATGLGWKAVAERADLSEQTVKALLYGRDGKKVKRIRSSTERKLLAVQAGRRRSPQPPDLLTTEADT